MSFLSAQTEKHKTAVRVCVLLFPLLIAGAAFLLVPALIALGEHMPPCLIHLATGFYCPGCGMTRSCLSLLRGDILSSLHFHPLPGILTAVCVLLYIELVLYVFQKRVRLVPRSPVFWAVAAAVLIVYLLLRNFIPAIMPI